MTYTPPHLFRDAGTLVHGHGTLVDADLGIELSAVPRQLAALRVTIAERLEHWKAATPEERATLPPVLTYCSDGGGTQSTTIKRLVEHGELPRPDVYLFADTQYESAEVYDGLRAMHGAGNDATSVPLIAATRGNLFEDQAVHRAGGDAREGKVKRQCTSEYKIEVVNKVVRMLLGLRPRQPAPRFGHPYVVEWLGISVDEIRRAKMSTDQWRAVEHPLIDLRMSRDDCRSWTARHGYPQPPRSACIGCPLRSDAEWVELKENHPAEFESAVVFDEAIRHAAGMERPCYVHRSCKPLAEVDVHSGGEAQGNLFAGCDTGWCGT